jgi:hypothetical protein
MGEDPGTVDLLKLLVITADITTVKIKKSDALAHKSAMQAWEEAKKNALGDRPVLPTQERWQIGDRIIADGDYVRRNAPQLYNKEGVVYQIRGSNIYVRLDNGYEHSLSANSPHISLVNPRPAVDMTAMQEEIDAWDLREAEYNTDNPKPPKPKGKPSTDYAVAVGEKLWGLYGSGMSMYLDLKDGSSSMKVANAYLKKKALEANLDVNDFLNTPLDLLNIEDPWCWEQEIDKVFVKGQKVKWTEVISQYPEAYRTAWYAHKGLREKIERLSGSEKAFKAHMKKYDLIDPQTNHRTPAPDRRSLQSRTVGQERSESNEYKVENVQQRTKLASELSASDFRLWEDSQDPCLQAIWERLRLENYQGQIVAELIEGEEDPDLIQAQRSRKDK